VNWKETQVSSFASGEPFGEMEIDAGGPSTLFFEVLVLILMMM
jgi:hypothetical protein